MSYKINIFESVKSEAIKELSSDILETGLDLLTDSETLKEIPIVGIAFKSFNIFQKVTETFFINKLLKFLYELKDIPLVDRHRFIIELENNNETKKAGEKLLITLNRLNDLDKAELIGRLFKNTIKGQINFKDFNRLTHMIDSAYIDDLNLLKNNTNLNSINIDIKSSLYQVGFLNLNIIDIESQKKFFQKRFGDNRDIEPKLNYSINFYSKILIEHGF